LGKKKGRPRKKERRRKERRNRKMETPLEWIKHRWFLVPIVLAIAGALIAYGQEKAENSALDSLQTLAITELDEKTDKINDTVDCLERDVQAMLRNQAVQNEFYKLLKPKLWEKAEETINNDTALADTMPTDMLQ